MKLTADQRRTVEHRGSDLLVAASAGSGKTEVLARRCLSLIADPGHPCRLDQLLVVTFTRAAAAELRARINQMLREEVDRTRDLRLRDHLRQQQVLIDAADIGTIDAWCARVVRAHFAATPGGVDPAFTILNEEQAALLRSMVLDELFDWVCTADEGLAARARELILRNPKPSNDFLRGLVLDLNRYREHLINPDQWLRRQRELYSQEEPAVRADAERVLADALAGECRFQQSQLSELIETIEASAVRRELQDYAAALATWVEQLTDAAALAAVVGEAAAFSFPRKPRGISARDAALREEVKTRWLDKRLKQRWQVGAVENVLTSAGRTAELLITLLQLEERYQAALAAKKRVRGSCEFSDVLRMALDLLGAPAAGERREPTSIARTLQQRYEHILVDEYQDTSPVQVELLRLVARSERGRSNRFLVGDVKQSIYGFREAEPRLFADLTEVFRQVRAEGQVLPLSDNFRSHADLVEGLNRLFEALFGPSLGGTSYGPDERLCARRDEVANPGLDARPRIDLQLVFEDRGGGESDEKNEAAADIPLERIEREALIAARRIHALLDAGVQIPERDPAGVVRLRPLRLTDIVILLRSAKGNAPRLAGALRQAGVPCVALGRESIFDSLEVQDLRNALTLLANRQQDVALAAYLHGPMVGMSAEQLRKVRRASRRSGFYAAVEAYRASGDDQALAERLDAAMAQLDRWTASARTQELSAVIQQVLRDTSLVHFARALTGGEHRVVMLRALQSLATDFSGRGGRGVAEFVEYLDALAEEDVRPNATGPTGADVVRIMTIHAAKGLEFPIVLLLGTAAAFSRRPQRGALECEQHHGVGIQFFDYPARTKLLNAAFMVNRQSAAQRELEEELRLLYVAATRARERLVIVGHTPEENWKGLRERYADGDGAVPLITRLSARSMLEWVMMGATARHLDWPRHHGQPFVRVETHEGGELAIPAAQGGDETPRAAAEVTSEDRQWVKRARTWLENPPDASLARHPAVLSVSAVKQHAARTVGEDVPRDLGFPTALRHPRFAQVTSGEDGLAVGNAYHRFMRNADLTRLASADEVRAQVAGLVADRRLSKEESDLLSCEDLVWFANTDEGRLATRHAGNCRREVPFVYALPVAGGAERMVLRGIVDCLIETEGGLVILDYKTDRLRSAAERETRIRAYGLQLQLYAVAAGAVFAQAVARAALVFLRERCVVPVSLEPRELDSLSVRVAGVAVAPGQHPVTGDGFGPLA